MHTEVDVVVVGGGLAGVACAAALSHQGQRVSLLEAGAELGGRACSWAVTHLALVQKEPLTCPIQ